MNVMKPLPKSSAMYIQMAEERAKKKGKKMENYLADLIATDYTSNK